jgi:hypothetical protein
MHVVGFCKSEQVVLHFNAYNLSGGCEGRIMHGYGQCWKRESSRFCIQECLAVVWFFVFKIIKKIPVTSHNSQQFTPPVN